MPESLVSRLGPLAMETAAATPIAPSSNVRERLGTAPPPRTQPLESRLGRSVVQNRNNSQTVSRRNDPTATANPASAAGPSTSAVPAEGVEPGSVLLWNRSISDTGRGLAASRAGAVQFHDYAPARRLEWVASGQYLCTFEYLVSYGRPTESPGTDATCSQGQVPGREQAQ